MKIATLLPVAGFFALAGLFFFAIFGGDPSEVPSALLGKPVPEFTLPPVADTGVPGFGTQNLKQGEVTVVNVWASWCVPCRKEHPLLEALAREVISVAEAKGLTLEAFDPFEPSGFTRDANAEATKRAFDIMVDYRNRSEKKYSGMWRDIAVRKRKTEVNQLLVPMVREADAVGVAVPLNKRMIELVYDIEEGAGCRAGIPWMCWAPN